MTRPAILVLAIESSFDDTAAAVVSSARRILANVVSSQLDTHERYRGTVPRLAAQQHRSRLPLVIREALELANTRIEDVDCIAATRGPGLASSLAVGYDAGRTLAAVHCKPFYGIHHMEGHALLPRLLHPNLEYPFLALLISGGHTLLLVVHGVQNYTILGTTLDDSAGEALDKAAVALNLKWICGSNGGPAATLEAVAASAPNVPVFALPVPLAQQAFNFSFSGLKTAFLRLLSSVREQHNDRVPAELVPSLAFSFQSAVAEHLARQLGNALGFCRESVIPVKSVVVSGGVARNSYIRSRYFALHAA